MLENKQIITQVSGTATIAGITFNVSYMQQGDAAPDVFNLSAYQSLGGGSSINLSRTYNAQGDNITEMSKERIILPIDLSVIDEQISEFVKSYVATL